MVLTMECNRRVYRGFHFYLTQIQTRMYGFAEKSAELYGSYLYNMAKTLFTALSCRKLMQIFAESLY